MGGLLKKPKVPAPPPLPPPPVATDANDPILTEDRLRRQRASGRASTIVSSLADATADKNTSVAISKLLGQ